MSPKGSKEVQRGLKEFKGAQRNLKRGLKGSYGVLKALEIITPGTFR